MLVHLSFLTSGGKEMDEAPLLVDFDLSICHPELFPAGQVLCSRPVGWMPTPAPLNRGKQIWQRVNTPSTQEPQGSA